MLLRMWLVDLEAGNVVLGRRARSIVGVSASTSIDAAEAGFVEDRAGRGAAVTRRVGAARSLKGLAALVRWPRAAWVGGRHCGGCPAKAQDACQEKSGGDSSHMSPCGSHARRRYLSRPSPVYGAPPQRDCRAMNLPPTGRSRR